jgi:hypothetical protein
MINKYNVLSFGISSVEDLDLLNKQFKLFKKYSKIPFNFYVMPGREQYNPNVNAMESIKQNISPDYNCIIPNYLNDNNNIMQNMSIFVGHSLNEFFNTVPKEKYFIVHLDCLPINFFDINEWVEDKPLFFIEQQRKHLRYAWDNICFIDTNVISPAEIDFSCGNFEGAQCDTGGGTYKIVNKYPSNCYGHTTKYLSNIETILSSNLSEHNKSILLKNYEIQLAESNAFGDPHWSELFLFDTLFHYRSFSGWHRKDQATLNIKEQRKQLLMDLK